MTFDLSQHLEENFDGTKICGGGAVDELGDDRLTLGELATPTVLGDDHRFVQRLTEQRLQVLGAGRPAARIAGLTFDETGVPRRLAGMSAGSEGSRELLIGAERDASGGVLVAVRDSGPGLNPESFERLFDPFYTTKPGGMGMGLSICRSIVEAHGGRIWASGTAGPGTTLQCILPVE